MSRAPVRQDDDKLVEVAPVVRRVVTARVSDPEVVDDLVQETLSRLVAARDRLEDDALAPYAVVIARNLVTSRARTEDRARRHRHRLIDLSDGAQPDEVLLRKEEVGAISAALGRLSDTDRRALVAHEVEGEATAEMAGDAGPTAGAVAVRLARARAKLRVEYLLSLRRIELPSNRCRPVLLALSAGDRRRQRQLDAGDHLLSCGTCASLSEPLLQRRLSLAVFFPFIAGWRLMGVLRNWVAEHPVHGSAGGGTAVGTAAVALLLASGHPAPARQAASRPLLPPRRPAATRPAPASTLSTAKSFPLLPLPARGDLRPFVGQAVKARGVPVQSVAADEGFWVGTSDDQRVWVRVVGLRPGTESPVTVRRATRLTFNGRMVANSPSFPEGVGVTGTEGAALLLRQGAHVEVAAEAIRAR